MVKDEKAIKEFLKEFPRCRFCGSATNLDVHHIIPRSTLRLDVPENLVTVCRKHHDAIESNICWRDYLALLKGYGSYEEMKFELEQKYNSKAARLRELRENE